MKTQQYFRSFTIIAILLFCSSLQAAVYYMTPTGQGDKSGTNWENAKASPTATLTIPAGDTYYLKVGTYTFNTLSSGNFFVINGSNVSIIGGFTGDGMVKSDTEATILDGTGVGSNDRRLLAMGALQSNVTVEGITFQNRNQGTAQGGAVLTRPGITFVDCVFKNNATSDNSPARTAGAGVCIADNATGTVNFTSCQFIGNNSTGTNGAGGAIGIGTNQAGTSYNLTVNITNCFFDGNTANHNGGAISMRTTRHTVNIENCTFVNNSSVTDGGAIYVSGGTVGISSSIFFNNTKGTADNNIAGETATKTKLLEISTTGLSLTSLPEAGVPESGEVSIPYTINSGYALPTVSVNGAAATSAANPYSTTITDNATLAFSATPQFLVSITQGEHSHATISGLTESGFASSASYPISGTAAAATGYHSPYVSVNGTYVAVASDGSFTYSPTVTKDTTFTVTAVAFEPNLIPVVADTWVDGRTVSGNNSSMIDLRAQASTTSYVRVSYLEFDADGFDISNYNRAELCLIFVGAQSGKSNQPKLHVRTVPLSGPINDMTWTGNQENNGVETRLGDAISGPVSFSRNSAAGTVVRFDVTDYVFDNLTSSLRLQVAGYEDNDPGFMIFHSLENGNAAYVPVLMFSKVPVFIGNGIWSDTEKWDTGNIPSNSESVVIDGNVTINSATTITNLTINAGKSLTLEDGMSLTVGGNIILKSDDINGAATIVGNVNATATVCQAIDKVRSWYMSLPVSMPSIKATVTDANVTAANVAGYSLFTENTDSWSTLSPNFSGVINAQGVMVNPKEGATSVNFTGTLNTGDVNLTGLTSGNKRWHFVGNPYPSYLAWSDLSKTNLEGSVWFRTVQNSSYTFATFNGVVGTNGADNVIAPSQGFWVRVNASETGALGFTNAMRSHYSSGNKFLRAPKVEDLPILRLAVNNGALTDETVLYFSANNNNGRDSYDAVKMMNRNSIPEIYSLIDNEAIVINAMETVPYNVELPIGFSTTISGNFSIVAKEFINFAADCHVYLIDKLIDSSTDLSEGESYNFSSEAVQTNNRFAVKLVPYLTTGIDYTTDDVRLFTNSQRQLVVSLGEVCDNAKVSVYSIAGQKIATLALTINVTTIQTALNSGVYVVEVINGGKHDVQRVVVR